MGVYVFTGLIDHCGRIKVIQETSKTLVLTIETAFTDLVVGESIAVDGACLTVVECDSHSFKCEISPETKQVTIIENYQLDTWVNLERALRLSDRLAGHFVTGHVDQTAIILDKNVTDGFLELFVEMNNHKNLLLKKGSIAINGVSLTVNEVFPDQIQLMLIPHTLNKTNLSHLSVGDRVNIELDWLAKIVANQIYKN